MSSSLLQLGGNSINDECNTSPLFKRKFFLVTNGGTSQFHNVVHFVPTNPGLLTQNLEEVLTYIDGQLQKTSVAIPAIGTGNPFHYICFNVQFAEFERTCFGKGLMLFQVNERKILNVKSFNPYHPNPEKIDDFDIAGSLGHK